MTALSHAAPIKSAV